MKTIWFTGSEVGRGVGCLWVSPSSGLNAGFSLQLRSCQGHLHFLCYEGAGRSCRHSHSILVGCQVQRVAVPVKLPVEPSAMYEPDAAKLLQQGPQTPAGGFL